MNCNIDNLYAVFESMLKEGWDTGSAMKWGYLFYEESKGKLVELFNEIEDRGYTLESIEKTDDGKEWKLFMTKVEIHTPESLNSRNEAMNRLAEHFDVQEYDGWDVERV